MAKGMRHAMRILPKLERTTGVSSAWWWPTPVITVARMPITLWKMRARRTRKIRLSSRPILAFEFAGVETQGDEDGSNAGKEKIQNDRLTR